MNGSAALEMPVESLLVQGGRKADLALLRRGRAGDKQAFDAFVESQLPLVAYVTNRRYRPNDERFWEYFQVGAEGLIKAAKHFDFDFGSEFSTYAVPKIDGEMRRYRRDHGDGAVPRVPRAARDAAIALLSADRDGVDVSDRDVCVEFLTDRGFREADARVGFEWFHGRVQRLSEPLHVHGEGDVIYLEDVVSDPRVHVEDEAVANESVREALRHVRPSYRKIALLRSEGRTQAEIAAQVGVSQAQVSRVLLAIGREVKREMREVTVHVSEETIKRFGELWNTTDQTFAEIQAALGLTDSQALKCKVTLRKRGEWINRPPGGLKKRGDAAAISAAATDGTRRAETREEAEPRAHRRVEMDYLRRIQTAFDDANRASQAAKQLVELYGEERARPMLAAIWADLERGRVA